MDPADIAQIELYILRRMREISPGDHASIAAGSGINLMGLRDWQAGDPITSVDWPQSSLNNFSPLITRQFEEDRHATVLTLVDASQSTLCGLRNQRIGTAVARAVAAIGFSAAFFQDAFGFVSFGDRFEALHAERARTGRSHVLHCLNRLLRSESVGMREQVGNAAATLSGYLAKASLVPVVSDFLFPNVAAVIDELAAVNTVHDVLLVMVDARLAFDLPATSAGWIEVFDVESGRMQTLSSREATDLTRRVEEWQRSVQWVAQANGLDVVKVGLDRWQSENALSALVAERRVRKVRM